MTCVSADNVCISYDGKRAVSNISFALEPGGYLAIVGENGSGKSTLVKGLVGICPLEAGTVTFGNGKKQAGYLPQQTKVRHDFPASVSEVVISGRTALLGLRPFFSSTDREIAALYMKKLGVDMLKYKPYSGLSGGEQRRVLLARALCSARSLLILDEPTAGLDPIIAAEFYRLLDEFRAETGAAIIIVSHDVEAAVCHADKILHMERGVRFLGTSEEYRATELGRTFMGCLHA